MIEWNAISYIFVAVYVAQGLVVIALEMVNHRLVNTRTVDIPTVFDGYIDEHKLERARRYAKDRSRLLVARTVITDLTMLAIVCFGLLSWTAVQVAGVGLPDFVAGALFFVALGAFFFALSLPFDYYENFVIEERYGFNRFSVAVWAGDSLKSFLISSILILVIATPVLWVIRSFPMTWWLWAAVIVALAQVGLYILYPLVIAPLFNRFQPLQNQELAAEVEHLVRQAGFAPRGVFEMDAGKRSSHSNAYFVGLGKARRIVLYDTLIESHTRLEILAILAHELGHAVLKHQFKLLVLWTGILFIGFFLTHRLMAWDHLYQTFHIAPDQAHAMLLLIGIFWQRVGYFISPLFKGLSRRFEREADRFAAERLGDRKTALAGALKQLACHNLTNIHPHPVYVWFHYSHPPIEERVSLLMKTE
jgi:STE24 endopeptidase